MNAIGLKRLQHWTVPDGTPAGSRALDLDTELARRGLVQQIA